MADPRNAVAFEGIRYSAETFLIDNSTITYSETVANGSSQVGLAVTLSADETVALAGDGELVLGKLIKVESDNKAVVQTKGYCTLPGGTSATLTVGLKIVGDLLVSAAGYIQAVSTQDTVSRGIIINNDTTTAVVVDLG
jgi:hypothetical protein